MKNTWVVCSIFTVIYLICCSDCLLECPHVFIISSTLDELTYFHSKNFSIHLKGMSTIYIPQLLKSLQKFWNTIALCSRNQRRPIQELSMWCGLERMILLYQCTGHWIKMMFPLLQVMQTRSVHSIWSLDPLKTMEHCCFKETFSNAK